MCQGGQGCAWTHPSTQGGAARPTLPRPPTVLDPSRPHGTHKALWPASCGCSLSSSSVPMRPMPSRASPCQQHCSGRRSCPGPGSVWVGGLPQQSMALGWCGGQDWPSPARQGCHWGSKPGQPSGFPGSPSSDSEEQMLPTSPGLAGRSVKVTLRPASLMEWGEKTGGGALRPQNSPGCQGSAPWFLPLAPTAGTQW